MAHLTQRPGPSRKWTAHRVTYNHSRHFTHEQVSAYSISTRVPRLQTLVTYHREVRVCIQSAPLHSHHDKSLFHLPV